MSEALKPCPFCGSHVIYVFKPTADVADQYDPSDRLYPIVRCRCGICTEGDDGDWSCVSAIAAWNTRAALSDTGEDAHEHHELCANPKGCAGFPHCNGPLKDKPWYSGYQPDPTAAEPGEDAKLAAQFPLTGKAYPGAPDDKPDPTAAMVGSMVGDSYAAAERLNILLSKLCPRTEEWQQWEIDIGKIMGTLLSWNIRWEDIGAAPQRASQDHIGDANKMVDGSMADLKIAPGLESVEAIRGLSRYSIRDTAAFKDPEGGYMLASQTLPYIASLRAEVERLTEHNQALIDASGQQCGCGYDSPEDVCLGHRPMHMKQKQRIAELERQLSEARAETMNTHALNLGLKAIAATTEENRQFYIDCAEQAYEEAARLQEEG